ncbi:hypothetical protein [Cyanobium sp. CH-040]|uniref:hypothetical protein n=1 Tax=Cyanobium sp. CH-040 TaxID=2823708 RepID=UPI0020CE9E0D|nr:hypothetical protein [Cyanobium sp. CH-040]MCP9926334.1 hypothetical protein [Cyanobium sp. CH-040]
MLRARQRGGGSLAERGYSLAVALIAAFVLLLGVAALASRGQLGFIGQAFQVQNRQARDVAEAAIAEFATTMNREENRYLLIAGNTANWGTGTTAAQLDNRNVCTVYDLAGQLIGSKRDAVPLDYSSPIQADIDRFRPNNGDQPLDRSNSDDNRTFVVESVQFLRETRAQFTAGTPGDTNPASDWVYRQEQLKAGNDRSLIRITVVGTVTQNNRTSTARVAREFEITPKCCKRSFGGQAATNWGRDRTPCSLEAFDGGRGFIIGLNGGGINPGTGGGGFDIRDERGLITQALCFGGTGGSAGDLSGSVNTTPCTSESLRLGRVAGGGTGVQFVGEEFNITFPRYAKSIPDDYLATQNFIDPLATPLVAKEINQASLSPAIGWVDLSIGGDRYIYFDTTLRQLRMCDSNGTSNCGPLAVDGNGRDVCYERLDIPTPTTSPRRPYAEVNCRLQSFNLGGNDVIIDTSNARINFFFDNPGFTGTYMNVTGNSDFRRVHCSWGSTPAFPCTYEVPWVDASQGRDFQALCDSTGASPCGLVDSSGTPNKLDYYDISELLNIYANGSGTFDLRGQSAIVGFNLYAPRASIILRGGGNAEPNFMGRLWVNSLTFSGGGNSLAIRIPASAPSFLPPGSTIFNTIDYYDFVARSFTQASGFGL